MYYIWITATRVLVQYPRDMFDYTAQYRYAKTIKLYTDMKINVVLNTKRFTKHIHFFIAE